MGRLRKTIARIASLSVCVLAAVSISTQQALASDLKPYTAEYKTTAMGMAMTLKRSLVEKDGVFTLRNDGSALLASLSEVAHFTVKDGHIRAKDFAYKLSSVVSRRKAVEFLPEQGIIRSLRKKEWTEHAWQPDVLDYLSQQEQLRLDLMAASEVPDTLSFIVVNGPKVSEKRLELVGTETLDTALGALETLHFRDTHANPDKRASDLWVAPSLDYLMVRTVHREDDTIIEINITKAALSNTD